VFARDFLRVASFGGDSSLSFFCLIFVFVFLEKEENSETNSQDMTNNYTFEYFPDHKAVQLLNLKMVLALPDIYFLNCFASHSYCEPITIYNHCKSF
jgi:hypothetical protein